MARVTHFVLALSALSALGSATFFDELSVEVLSASGAVEQVSLQLGGAALPATRRVELTASDAEQSTLNVKLYTSTTGTEAKQRLPGGVVFARSALRAAGTLFAMNATIRVLESSEIGRAHV